MDKIRILVADSRKLLLEGIAKCLGEIPKIEVVSVCSTGGEAVKLATKLTPDVILMDATIRGCDCKEAIKRIRETNHKIRFIITTPLLHEYPDALSLVDMGANGYVDIDIDAIRLVDNIEQVLNGRNTFSPLMAANIINNQIHGSDITKKPKNTEYSGDTPLSRREDEVLVLLSQGLTNKEIAQKLFVTENTVKAHLHSILKKLQVRTRAQAVFVTQNKRLATRENR